MARAEFPVDATVADEVKQDDDQLVSHRHDGLLFPATAAHPAIQRGQMGILLVRGGPSRLAQHPARIAISSALAPALWPFEVASAVTTAERRAASTLRNKPNFWSGSGNCRSLLNTGLLLGCASRFATHPDVSTQRL